MPTALSYARATSIVDKSGSKRFDTSNLKLGEQAERDLIRQIAYFPLIVEEAAIKFRPDIITQYAHTLSQRFNTFYNSCKILTGDEKTESRLALVESYRVTTRNAMSLLGIQVPDRM